MATINQEYFERFETLRFAKGQSPYEEDSSPDVILGPKGDVIKSLANGGLVDPKPVEINPPCQLVRIACGPFANEVAGGSWWMSVASYNEIFLESRGRGVHVSVGIREMCAVPVPFNPMTMIVVVKVMAPLSAYSGKGNAAKGSYKSLNPITKEKKAYLDETVIPRGMIEQLYIPGLSSPDLRRRALFIVGWELFDEAASRKGFTPIHNIPRSV
jgi:hypothetical protein